MRGLRFLRRRLAFITVYAAAVLRRTALIAIVGEDPAAVARACAFCSLPGGARVIRLGGAVLVAVQLGRTVNSAGVERWVRHRLRAFRIAGVGVVETSWEGVSVADALNRATSLTTIDAMLAAERAATPPRRHRPRRFRPAEKEAAVAVA